MAHGYGKTGTTVIQRAAEADRGRRRGERRPSEHGSQWAPAQKCVSEERYRRGLHVPQPHFPGGTTSQPERQIVGWCRRFCPPRTPVARVGINPRGAHAGGASEGSDQSRATGSTSVS